MNASLQGSENDQTPEPAFLGARLAMLIFLAFAIMGAWVPVFSLHLKSLEFSAVHTAWASAAYAIGALIAPIVWGQIADRWLAMQRCISLCSGVTCFGLWLLADQSEPGIVIFGSIAVWFFLIPVIGLTTSLIFRQLLHADRDYGRIRLWGTIGWMAVNWCLTLWFALNSAETKDWADSLRLGSIAALVLAIYAWTLPNTPPGKSTAPAGAWLARLIDAPLSAMHLFQDRSFVVYCVCYFGFYITQPFTIQLNPLLLDKLEVAPASVPICLTIAQSTEVLFLYLLPVLLARFGTKRVMAVGALAWTIGLGLLSLGSPLWLVLSSLITNGVFICCFIVAGQVFVNRLATDSIRASAQAVLVFICGSGLLLGHLLVGWIRVATNDQYGTAYLVACAMAASLSVFFLSQFARPHAPAQRAISRRETLVTDAEIT